MRLTVQLDTFNRAHPMAFAILWLDKEKRQWSREGHFGLELPEWGSLHVDCGNTHVCEPNDRTPVYVLERLNLDCCYGLFEGVAGRAEWCAEGGHALMTGHWHVQCIDNERVQPEHGLFATGEDS
ncbi:conserved hypothetical protein [Paraburkholderia ribeironis]|uniref:DUF3564 domain-containing protein n=1 Tax=Paraburkholderia ribeironis TaxID=1247936 RepID=A0A1N7S817_9BURK|nr:DUF3564 family protein [Paraburkholderia ribeironis]SIT43519.1 conserved hypothetical protein [Paraburkholderia ribeironis]